MTFNQDEPKITITPLASQVKIVDLGNGTGKAMLLRLRDQLDPQGFTGWSEWQCFHPLCIGREECDHTRALADEAAVLEIVHRTQDRPRQKEIASRMLTASDYEQRRGPRD